MYIYKQNTYFLILALNIYAQTFSNKNMCILNNFKKITVYNKHAKGLHTINSPFLISGGARRGHTTADWSRQWCSRWLAPGSGSDGGTQREGNNGKKRNATIMVGKCFWLEKVWHLFWNLKYRYELPIFNTTENELKCTNIDVKYVWNHMKSNQIMVQLISLQNQKHLTKSKALP
mgnify:CR=1 FL=1